MKAKLKDMSGQWRPGGTGGPLPRLRGQRQLTQATCGCVAGASGVSGGADNQDIRVFVQNLLSFNHC